jgi:hypothetical protein
MNLKDLNLDAFNTQLDQFYQQALNSFQRNIKELQETYRADAETIKAAEVQLTDSMQALIDSKSEVFTSQLSSLAARGTHTPEEVRLEFGGFRIDFGKMHFERPLRHGFRFILIVRPLEEK